MAAKAARVVYALRSRLCCTYQRPRWLRFLHTSQLCSGREENDVRERSGPVLRFAKLSEHAYTPTRGSARAAGYDLYSAYEYVIAPHDKAIVKTDIQICVPRGCYGRVAPRSGLAAKHFIDVGGWGRDETWK